LTFSALQLRRALPKVRDDLLGWRHALSWNAKRQTYRTIAGSQKVVDSWVVDERLAKRRQLSHFLESRRPTPTAFADGWIASKDDPALSEQFACTFDASRPLIIGHAFRQSLENCVHATKGVRDEHLWA
jgi:hypothetical protein